MCVCAMCCVCVSSRTWCSVGKAFWTKYESPDWRESAAWCERARTDTSLSEHNFLLGCKFECCESCVGVFCPSIQAILAQPAIYKLGFVFFRLHLELEMKRQCRVGVPCAIEGLHRGETSLLNHRSRFSEDTVLALVPSITSTIVRWRVFNWAVDNLHASAEPFSGLACELLMFAPNLRPDSQALHSQRMCLAKGNVVNN